MGKILYLPVMTRKPANKPTDDLPNRIRWWRIHRGMLVNELASIIGVTRPQMSRLETGQRPITTEWLDRIARALDVTTADLLNDQQNPYALTDAEKALIDQVRASDGQILPALSSVAQTMRPYVGQGEVLPFPQPRKTG